MEGIIPHLDPDSWDTAVKQELTLMLEQGFGASIAKVVYAGELVCTGAELEEMLHRLFLSHIRVYSGVCIRGERA